MNVLSEFCRICLNKFDILQNIFDEEYSQPKLSVMLMEVAAIQVDNNDQFPSSMCSECTSRLTDAYGFKKTAQKSHNIIQNLLSENEIELLRNEDAMEFKVDPDLIFPINNCGQQQDMKSEEIIVNPTEKLQKETIINKCSISKETFLEVNNLSQHIKNVHKGALFVCEICKATYLEEDSFLNHLKTGSCLVSNVKSKTQFKANVNIQVKIPNTSETDMDIERPHVCSYCPKRFTTRHYLKEHTRKMHLRTTVYMCKICKKPFRYRDSAKIHVRIHSKNRTFFCNICNRQYCDLRKLRHHYKQNHLDIASNNGASLQNQVLLKADSKRTNNIKEFENSNESDKISKTGNNSKQCIEVKNSFKKEEYICEIGNKTINCKHSLTIHSLSGQFHYNECDDQFSDTDLLEQHNRVNHLDVDDNIPIVNSKITSDLNSTKRNSFSSTSCKKSEICHVPPNNFKNKKISNNTKLYIPNLESTNLFENQSSFEMNLISISSIIQTEKQNASKTENFISDNSDQYRMSSNDTLNKVHNSKLNTPDNTNVTCNLCNKSLISLNVLKLHMRRMHSRRISYKCNSCNRLFKYKDSLQRHAHSCFVKKDMILNKKRLLACKLCGNHFSTLNFLRRHFRLKHYNNTDKCNDAVASSDSIFNSKFINTKDKLIFASSESLSNGKKLSESLILKESGNAYYESDTSRNFETSEYLDNQVAVDNETRNESTSDVSNKIRQSNGISDTKIQEKNSHTLTKQKFVCKICSTSFNRNDGLQRHLYKHFEGSYKCTDCEKKFSSFLLLVKHEKTEHRTKREFICILCDEIYPTRSKLTDHMCIHVPKTNTKKTKLNIRNKIYVDNSEKIIQNKARIAQNEHDNKIIKNEKENDIHFDMRCLCPICSKVFENQNLLMIHRNKCCRQESKKCQYCKQTFDNISNFNHHILQHYNISRYECKICYEKFDDNPTLFTHLRIHFDNCLCMCIVCGGQFKNSSTLRDHVKTHSSSVAAIGN